MDLRRDLVERRRGAAALAVSGQVDGDASNRAAEPSTIGRQVRRSKVRPCRNTTGTPLPSISYASFVDSCALEILGRGLATFPLTDDPAADLVEGAIVVFRRFAIEHPSLFEIALQRPPSPQIKAGFGAAQAEAVAGLEARVERLQAAGLLRNRPVWAVLCEFDALCEGLAALELRGISRHSQIPSPSTTPIASTKPTTRRQAPASKNKSGATPSRLSSAASRCPTPPRSARIGAKARKRDPARPEMGSRHWRDSLPPNRKMGRHLDKWSGTST